MQIKISGAAVSQVSISVGKAQSKCKITVIEEEILMGPRIRWESKRCEV